MNISEISNNLGVGKTALGQESKVSSGESFSDMLKSAVQEVNQKQVNAYDAMQGIAVQRIEEADLTLKLSLEVKNKALNAYKEIMKMQV
jgi:flagellar hook-basal body complex protein FliE